MRNVMKKGLSAGAMAVSAATALISGFAWGADTGTQSSVTQIEEITITAAKLRSLEQFTPTGSRLGLSEQELPATLDLIDNDEMIGRGLFNVQQAADSQPGVTSGGSPGRSEEHTS